MSKVNFVSEFNAFMRYARDNSLSLRERMLWIALFYIANDRAVYNEQTQEYEWPDDFIQVSNGEMNLYCCLDKRAIETLRNGLKQRGLIDFQPGLKNKKNPAYRINYLSVVNVGDKNAPNNTTNHAPNNVPSYAPNRVPNNAPNPASSCAENPPVLGANLYPTMPPFFKNKYINHTQDGYGADTGSEQKYSPEREGGLYPAGTGIVDLNGNGGRFEGLVPLRCEEG